MKNIHSFFNELRLDEGAIWLDNNTIKLSASQKFQNQETKDFIKNNKSQIVSILNENRVFSKNIFFDVIIFRDRTLKYYPLSPAQERLWFIEQFEGGTNAYHVPAFLELDTTTDVEGIKYAIRQVISRHEVLRSTIEHSEELEHGVQIVHDEPFAIEEIILSDNEDYDALIKEDVNRPFNLSCEYPIRVKFYHIQSPESASFQTQVNRTLLVINSHHIASDGWSMVIFFRELYAYYKSYINKNTDFCLPTLEIQYKDYAVWQRAYLTGETLEKQLNYWKLKLLGCQTLELPTDYVRPTKLDYKGSYLRFILEESTCHRLKALTQRYGITLNSLMLSSVSILLGKYTGQDDIVIGSPIANRHHQQTEGLIGFFVNTQANRVILGAMQSFEELIHQVHQEQVEAQLHQDLPFERLVEGLDVQRDVSRHPLFQVMFSLQSFGNRNKTVELQKDYLRPFQAKEAFEIEKFDLSIFIDEEQEELIGNISYATSLFHRDTIERLAQNYTTLLARLVEFPRKPYSQLSLLTSEEQKRIVYDWNEINRIYPKDKAVHQIFQELVERTPDRIALVCEYQQLTYKELNEQSNQLARRITAHYKQEAKQTLPSDTLIALYLDRSLEMIIGILAVLKTGAAYVPMDPTYPQDRVDYILVDTCTELILSQKHLIDEGLVQLPSKKVIAIDLTEKIYKEENVSNLQNHSSAEDLAYIIYTSGTSGKPKGVMVEHHQVVSFAIGNNYINNEKSHVVAGLSNYAFDGSVFDIFYTLLNGKTLVLINSNNLLDLSKLNNQLVENNVNTIFITTALFNSLVQNEAKCLGTLQQVLFGGEACNIEMVNKFKRFYSKSSLIHVYGPTENIVYSTYCNLSEYDTKNVVPIGKHLSDKKNYIFDRHLNPVPVGVIGELYIGGEGVARGYLKRPELTNERFILNPFATDEDKTNSNTRLYKTGDLVRWLPDGNIKFIGRNDDQVKIRGFRIELGEIEHSLTQISGIKQSCVLAKERKTETSSNKYLVGYYVLDGSDDTLTPTIILDRLSQVLPEYMIPSALVVLGSLPLTINGKVDKRMLPDPDFIQTTEDYMAPTTGLELELCKIWQEVLGLGRVGVSDDFFRKGGNSILAIQASHRMSKALGCDIKVADIFKHKTISQLLLYSSGQIQIHINKTSNKQSVLSFAQERLWFIEQYQGGATAYHIPVVYELDSNTSVEGMKYALQQVVARHEVLRSTIEQLEDQNHGLQVVREEPLKIEEITLPDSGGYEALIKADINRPFELSREYPIRVKFYHIYPTDTNSISSCKTLLLVNIHHIASDGWSTVIFQKELYAYYEAYINKVDDFFLPALDIQYKDYAVWQRTYLTGDILDKQLSYWKSRLLGYQTLELPIDFPRPSEIDYRGAYQGIVLDRPTSQKLRSLVQRHASTLHSVMLGSAGILLGKYTGQNDIVIGSPTANRHHQQTEQLIGFFVNTQANRLLLSSTQNFDDLILQTHQGQMEAQLYQDLPFEKLVEELGVARDTSRHPIFQVMFSVQSFSGRINKEDKQKSYLRSFYFAGAYEIAKFDLSIHIDDSQEELKIQISYVPALFRKETIERFITHYKRLLTQLVEFPEKPYSQFSLLSIEEHQRILFQWNKTDKDYPREKTINQLFQEQVERTPGNIALTHNEQRLTYLELNERSNQLARHIRGEYQRRAKQPLLGDALIALYLDRSLELVIGIFAVLKAGGAYIPIDTNYPQDRVDYILDDTQTELILTQKHLRQSNHSQLPYEKVISIDLTEDVYGSENKSNLPEFSKSTDLAYVIYTSGTTGKPKGATIAHRSVCNYNQWINNHSCYIKTHIVDCSSSISFDATVNVLLTPLCNGQHVVICDEIIKHDINLYVDYIHKHKIELIKVTPSYFTLLLNNIRGNKKLDYLKCIIVGGEKANKVEVEEFIGLYSEIAILHHYGPTETTVGITSFTDFSNTKLLNNLVSIPLGKVANNNQAYVLDSNKTPVPIGLIGELYIGGVNLARGYLNRPDLTEERFVSNPFATEFENSNNYFTLYKTGDLVKWLPDGNIEFIGRNDGQVKISGYRIELGEIEYALKQITGVKHCCVIDKERKTEGGSNKYLVAYYVLDDGNDALTPNIILDRLSKVLPDYMMPSALVALESIPLNINGKLDRQALPDPNFSLSAEKYVPPTNDLEAKLCQIWQEVLGLDRVGITDNFFEMGGNSILAIQLSHRMSKALRCLVNVASIFKYSSIEVLLKNVINKQVNFENVEIEF